MEFYQKLQKLRKENGMSQEEFAERLGVSRQAVSKWENGQGFPETEKLIQISNLLNVSLDSLLKEEPTALMESEPGYYASRETVEGYLTFKRTGAGRIALAVCLFILSVLLPLLLPGALGTILMLLVIGVGVTMLVALAFRPHRYDEVEKQPLVMDPGVLREYRAALPGVRRRYGKLIVAGIALLFVGLVLLLLLGHRFDGTAYEAVSMVPLFLAGAAAVPMFIIAGSAMEGIAVIASNNEYIKEEREDDRYGAVYGALMPLAAIAFLAIGFVWGAWHPGWLVFPATAVLCTAIVGIIKAVRHES